ncbi:hypothetical protein [Rhodopseudomonas sp. B29]|uniref:hypothetical protein n=1 Tax=Rhodopseudomonas sp. B29 TaxID=95607 RepID=UPI0003B66EFC|nr:hypothetical protein [Rhodopseudomonas sp. B29]
MARQLEAAPRGYFADLGSLIVQALARLVREPSHSRRAEAKRRWARHALLLTAVLACVIVLLMFVVDAYEINLMPKRGTPSLWPVKILTDFGKSQYVLWVLGLSFVPVLLVLPRLSGAARATMIGIGTRTSSSAIAARLVKRHLLTNS